MKGDAVDEMFAGYLNKAKLTIEVQRISASNYMFGTKKILAKIINGRLAIFGIFSLISEATVPGSVAPLDALKIPAYEGNPLLLAPIAGLAAW